MATPTVFIADDTGPTDRDGEWRSATGTSPDGLLLSADTDDVDDELALPAPMVMRLHALRFDIPVGVILPLPAAPAAPLPRPPDLA